MISFTSAFYEAETVRKVSPDTPAIIYVQTVELPPARAYRYGEMPNEPTFVRRSIRCAVYCFPWPFLDRPLLIRYWYDEVSKDFAWAEVYCE